MREDLEGRVSPGGLTRRGSPVTRGPELVVGIGRANVRPNGEPGGGAGRQTTLIRISLSPQRALKSAVTGTICRGSWTESDLRMLIGELDETRYRHCGCGEAFQSVAGQGVNQWSVGR